jgi:hypothetical protein
VREKNHDALQQEGLLDLAPTCKAGSAQAGRPARTRNIRWCISTREPAVSVAALLLVSRGEAPAGIVYQTDAAADKGVTIIGSFPEDTHPPITYPIALTTNAGPDAAAFLAYIKVREIEAAVRGPRLYVGGRRAVMRRVPPRATATHTAIVPPAAVCRRPRLDSRDGKVAPKSGW